MIRDLSVHFTRGWTGIVGANGVGKNTILKLATGGLEPRQGQVSVEDDWMARWTTLSHGERKRAQIAVDLWRKP